MSDYLAIQQYPSDWVKIRTQQLTETLDEVQKLKIQQDGDYFLTSLLIQPLTGNYVQSPNVSVDMLLRQKKQFQFRHWQAEIGGDLCIAQNIQLKEKTYTVFLNGDAMGKSIQGAGGALVLGTVFKSMVARTQMTPDAQDKYPEQWLKECFLELQSVFVSFDGSMMVSAVFGLVDEVSGLLYYINAEHPFVVLYRDKAAEFLENDITLRKLGVSGMSGVLQVKTFQLEPNDVVIIGSDGRDDVQIGVDENGNRIINENEMEFLRHVEKGEANLRKIEQSILGFGTLTDDFTLLRIGFKETGVMAREVDENNRIAAYKAEVRKARALTLDGKLDEAIFILEQAMDLTTENASAMRLLSRVLIQRKLFDRAANVSESYTMRFPADTEFLYVTSYAYAKSGAQERAIAFAERCRLRDPSLVRNLLHLAKLYKETGRSDLAERALEDALQTDPTHEKAKLFLADLAN
ncbi:MAG: SpoIIE family protein phosphatase [Spirochaetia bacterium]|nr:SpoIIE family protein phosphatase [Spirochaetia bacterium]